MKKIFKNFLVTLLLMSMPISSLAYNSDEHDCLMRGVLFGDTNFGKYGASQKYAEKIEALEDASYLTIDQFNDYGQEDLNFLNSFGVRLIPKSVRDINFSGNQRHRMYTHKGWNHNYTSDVANWETRKKILINTVDKVFETNLVSGMLGLQDKKTRQKKESFAAIVYYIHIIGDYSHRTNYSMDTLVIPFAVAHPSKNEPDVFFELKEHLQILFQDTKGISSSYSQLMMEFSSIEEEARNLVSQTGGINNKNRFLEQQSQVTKLIELLSYYLPNFLMKEEFFRNTFPDVKPSYSQSVLFDCVGR